MDVKQNLQIDVTIVIYYKLTVFIDLTHSTKNVPEHFFSGQGGLLEMKHVYEVLLCYIQRT